MIGEYYCNYLLMTGYVCGRTCRRPEVKLLFKTSFKALKFFKTPKLQKNDKNVNISSSSDRKRTNNGSLESSQ